MTRYEFFWGKEDICSNFFLEDFTDEEYGHSLCCSEQGYMHRKAIAFGDYDMADKIMLLKDPGQIKKAGRLVKNFDTIEWDKVSDGFMFDVVLQKALKSSFGAYLLNLPLDTIFVEASPYDRKWGIGLSRYDAIRIQESLWPGENRLGKIINRVQKKIYQINK